MSGESSLADHLQGIESSFVRGAYRQVLQQADAALAHYPHSGSLKLWRAIATEALGHTDAALKLVRPLTLLPETAQQAQYLLRIWEAPRLRRPEDWTSRIPDLSQLPEASPEQPFQGSAPIRPSSKRPPPPSDPGDLPSNRPIWVSLAAIVVVTLASFVLAELWEGM